MQAVAALEQGDVLALLVGDEALVAVAVLVCEAQLGAGVGALLADDQAGALGPAGEVDPVGQLGDPGPLALLAVGVERRSPTPLRKRDGRRATRSST